VKGRLKVKISRLSEGTLCRQYLVSWPSEGASIIKVKITCLSKETSVNNI